MLFRSDAILEVLKAFSYEKTDVPDTYIKNSGREMNQHYWDQLVEQTFWHFGNKLFLPFSVRAVITTVKSVKYIWKGLQTLFQGKIEVPVLDATAIGVSIIRGDLPPRWHGSKRRPWIRRRLFQGRQQEWRRSGCR